MLFSSQWKICTSSATLDWDERNCLSLDFTTWICRNLFAAHLRNSRVAGARRVAAHIFRISRVQADLDVYSDVWRCIFGQHLRHHGQLYAGPDLRHVRAAEIRLLYSHHTSNAGTRPFV